MDCEEKSCYPATGNLLIGRAHRLKSTSTCGLNYPEEFCIVSHLESRAKCFMCDSRQRWSPYNTNSHQIENVVNAYPLTNNQTSVRGYARWWQSQNGVHNVSIQLDLEAEFHVTHAI